MNIAIRPETPTDYPTIYSINEKAFGQINESELIEKLRQGDAFIPQLSLLASFNGQTVGHILFSRITIEGTEKHSSLALAPMSVLPAFQKQGIGKELVTAGLEKAKALGEGSVIVLGHQEYYPKFGFQPASRWNIHCPFEVPDSAFMALELVPGGLEGVEGTVVYDEAFLEV